MKKMKLTLALLLMLCLVFYVSGHRKRALINRRHGS